MIQYRATCVSLGPRLGFAMSTAEEVVEAFRPVDPDIARRPANQLRKETSFR